ncbi:hypothetical protein BJV74DRAFT_815854 [Russula compacta]|nr:hypothetical protein BJV74DRAFT_815854 [Russula compacta]
MRGSARGTPPSPLFIFFLHFHFSAFHPASCFLLSRTSDQHSYRHVTTVLSFFTLNSFRARDFLFIFCIRFNDAHFRYPLPYRDRWCTYVYKPVLLVEEGVAS